VKAHFGYLAVKRIAHQAMKATILEVIPNAQRTIIWGITMMTLKKVVSRESFPGLFILIVIG